MCCWYLSRRTKGSDLGVHGPLCFVLLLWAALTFLGTRTLDHGLPLVRFCNKLVILLKNWGVSYHLYLECQLRMFGYATLHWGSARVDAYVDQPHGHDRWGGVSWRQEWLGLSSTGCLRGSRNVLTNCVCSNMLQWHMFYTWSKIYISYVQFVLLDGSLTNCMLNLSLNSSSTLTLLKWSLYIIWMAFISLHLLVTPKLQIVVLLTNDSCRSYFPQINGYKINQLPSADQRMLSVVV